MPLYDQSYGGPTVGQTLQIPSGPAGVRMTLRLMSQMVKQFKQNLTIRELALSLIRDVPGRKNWGEQVSRIHTWVQMHIQYVRDINGVETLQTPLKTLEYGQGDCDDQCTLLASLLESIGHPTRFVAMAETPLGPHCHVFTETLIRTDWIAVETTEPWAMGQQPPNSFNRMVEHN